MKFVPSTRDDIIRYYKNTFVKFQEFGDKLFLISNVDLNRITGVTEDNEPFVLYLDEEAPYEVDYILPHKSFFQYGMDACLLERIPAKQYYRGLCNNNTKIQYLVGGTYKQHDLNFDLLKAFVTKQKFFTLDEAVDTDKAVRTCVLNPRMMYYKEKKTIYIDFTEVAHVNKVKKSVFMKKHIFTDEIKELLAHSKYKIMSEEGVLA